MMPGIQFMEMECQILCKVEEYAKGKRVSPQPTPLWGENVGKIYPT